MSKHSFFLLGNGFTIDFLNHIKVKKQSDVEIDVVNLFRLGATVVYPEDSSPGFLSYKHCENLWRLGALVQDQIIHMRNFSA